MWPLLLGWDLSAESSQATLSLDHSGIWALCEQPWLLCCPQKLGDIGTGNVYRVPGLPATCARHQRKKGKGNPWYLAILSSLYYHQLNMYLRRNAGSKGPEGWTGGGTDSYINPLHFITAVSFGFIFEERLFSSGLKSMDCKSRPLHLFPHLSKKDT